MNIPDNYDRFVQHDRERQKWLERQPKCEYCGEPIQDDHLFDLEGTLYHVECAEQEFKKPTSNYVE